MSFKISKFQDKLWHESSQVSCAMLTCPLFFPGRNSRASILSLSDDWEDLHHSSSSPPNRLTPLHSEQQRRNIKIPSTIREKQLQVSPTNSSSRGLLINWNSVQSSCINPYVHLHNTGQQNEDVLGVLVTIYRYILFLNVTQTIWSDRQLLYAEISIGLNHLIIIPIKMLLAVTIVLYTCS